MPLPQAVLPSEWGAHLGVSCLQTALQHDVPVPGHGPLHGQHDLRLGQEGERPRTPKDEAAPVPPPHPRALGSGAALIFSALPFVLKT